MKLEHWLGSKLNSYIEVWPSTMESRSHWRQRHSAGLEDKERRGGGEGGRGKEGKGKGREGRRGRGQAQ